MRPTPFHAAFAVVSVSALLLGGCASPPSRDALFVTRSTAKSPAEVHEAIREHVKRKEWVYVNDNKLKGGEITQVRICDLKAATAADIWSAGLQVSAMLPCGHLSLYREGGVTKVTLLHPRFLTLLDPHPAVVKLADGVTGPYLAMLEEITR